jgi:hypothetical protein
MSGGHRQVVSHAAIGVSLCIGAYSFFVEPIHKRLAECRAREDQAVTDLRPAEGLQERLGAIKTALERADQEAARIRELGQPARDERDLFASVTSLAETCHVRIDQLAPLVLGPSASPGAARDPGAPAGPAPSARDAVAGYTIAVVCSYQDLAEFLRQIRSELGYSMVRSVRLTPLADERVRAVQAVIETEHYSFDASPDSPAPSGGAPTASAGARP